MKLFFKKYWWQSLIILLVVGIIVIRVINNANLNGAITDILRNLGLLIMPLGVILGLVLGYPLLKRKLVDSYITRQFEKIYENNAIVKKECLRLQEKYPVGYISRDLTKEFLQETVDDVRSLNQMCIDANLDAYKYSYLVYKSLSKFNDFIGSEIKCTQYPHFYCEEISSFVNIHLNSVYKYARSLGYISSSRVKTKNLLVDNISRYVTENKLYQVEDSDQSLSYKYTSALLVLFFSNNLNTLNEDNSLLSKCCYTSVPSPSSFARIMYNRRIYIPPILIGKKIWNMFPTELSLVSLIRRQTTNCDSGVVTYSYIICYANITMGGFIAGTMKEKSSLDEFHDGYLNNKTLISNDIKEYKIFDEMLQFQIDASKLEEYFCSAKIKLMIKMKGEVN